jgi:hypothetical protein
MSKTFDDIAAAQGWNADSREQILREFIDGGYLDLDDYAQKRAFEENEGSEFAQPPSPSLPDFSMDVVGEYTGNAYPEQTEYRIHMAQETDPDKPVVLWVEHSSGARVGQTWFSPADIDGITSMASIDHSLSGYEDDWSLPSGMDRQLIWTLQTDLPHYVRLDAGNINEIAVWLGYATGENEWTGSDTWEY